MTQPTHESVMREELVAAVLGAEDGSYIDATFGRGGHARALLEALAPSAQLLVIDRDVEAVSEAQKLCAEDSRVSYAHSRFADMEAVARSADFADVDGVMFDVGVSSPQLDQAERGFSFRMDGPLDMRMDTTQGQTAAEWINSATRAEMSKVFRDYGEERNAYRIAGAIERARPINGTAELAAVIEDAQPRPDRHKHAATRVFQAIRIFVNDELGELRAGLAAGWELLRPGGKLAVISFHSLEDRIVKRAFKALAKPSPMPRRLPIQAHQEEPPKARVLPLQKARDTEVVANPRARSAVLRTAERLR